jgi:excisionase family DNA binding protein
MRSLTTIPQRPAGRLRSNAARLLGHRSVAETAGFTPLIDAKAAGRLLGVPHTWLLAQARAGLIPHHRLGHYVRFNPDDLQDWLRETRSMPHEPRPQAQRPGGI